MAGKKASLILIALALLVGLVLLALVAGLRTPEQAVASAPVTSSAMSPSTTEATEDTQGFLHGRVTTHGGDIYEGRLRWGGDQEAFWGDYFNGFKDENPWAAYVPRDQLPKERRSVMVFGIEVAQRDRQTSLRRPFMARFGDIARIEARGAKVLVTLKSGTVFDLDRHSAGDFDDGVRVWDAQRGVVDLGPREIRTVELLPGVGPGATPNRLHGTVHTRQGDFTGFVQWNRQKCVGADELDGHTADGELSVRFDSIRAIARDSPDSALVTLLDDREIVLSGTREMGHKSRGTYVDDRRYGRVLVSWDAFERVDFNSGGGGPAYDDFPPGRPLSGTVTTLAGRRLTGRLIYDLDESETTETLDAPFAGVDYTIPFGLVASIVLPGEALAKVTLHDGEKLQLERAGDLGEGNAGMLIFIDGQERPEYLPWTDVERIDLDIRPSERGLFR